MKKCFTTPPSLFCGKKCAYGDECSDSLLHPDSPLNDNEAKAVHPVYTVAFHIVAKSY